MRVKDLSVTCWANPQWCHGESAGDAKKNIDTHQHRCYCLYMIINKPAPTVRSAAKRAGYLDAITIRTGRAAERAEVEYVSDDQCSVRIAVQKPGVERFLDECGGYAIQAVRS